LDEAPSARRPTEMSSLSREFDVIIFGATGYTGEHTARALSKMAASGGAWAGVKWAIAGRSEKKLSAIVDKWGLAPTGVLVADTSDEASLVAMTARCAVLMNATGPYRFYGEAVVRACIATCTDYTDLCGEPEFIDRCQLKHADAAKAAGVFIVHACAFDSVPADIGCLFTALQFPPPALCAHADMYHTISVAGNPKGAYAHATTFYAAVHGFGGASATRAQRKELLAKLEAEAPGSSKPPPPLGPKLRVAPGPTYKPALRRYAFLFPGSDVAVVRASQRALCRAPPKKGEPYLTPQFGASFTVASPVWAGLVALIGLTFNLLSGYGWGRKLLLRHPELFTLGAFSDAGPTEEMLSATTWRTVFLGKGWGAATADAPPPTGFDRAVTCSVSGPEPGYVATALMYLTMARFVRDERKAIPARGGVYTPAGLVGAGGAAAVHKLVASLRAVGIRFDVDKPLHVIVPKLPKAGAPAARPRWQVALNCIALAGWACVLAGVLCAWSALSLEWGAPFLRSILALEAVCAFEVVQIATGAASGNLPLGVGVHATRLLEALVIMPSLPSAVAPKLVVLAWSLTEVCRYPMFLQPGARAARVARYVMPVLTFPLGAGAEAVAAYDALTPLAAGGASRLLYCAVALVVPMNTLGGLAAYGAILRKARASLKPTKPENKE